jgi:ABC-type branched-subunit amino acid transport system substrate-binding protein
MVKACLDFANENNIYILFPSITYSFAPPEQQKNVYFLRNHFEIEAKTLVEYALKNFLHKKIVFFYQNDAFGIGQLNAAVEKLKSKGITSDKWLAVPQDANSANVAKATKQINDFAPDCIFFFVVPVAGMSLLSKIKLNQSIKILGSTSFNSKILNNFLKGKGIGITRSYAFPNMYDKSIEISKEYLEELTKINQEPETYSFAAYISTDVFIEILKKVQDPITGDKIVEAMKTIKNFNCKGFHLNYNEKTKCLSSDIWIETEDGKWIYAPKEE